MDWRRLRSMLLCAAALAGCSPALDWRQVHPEASAATALFPCKPAGHSRRVQLGTQSVELFVHACSASGATFALAFATVAEPAQVGPALHALEDAAAANLGGTARVDGNARVNGATPNPEARRLRIEGHLPSGGAAHMVSAFFAKDTRVFQASMVSGEPLDEEAVETFFGALSVRS